MRLTTANLPATPEPGVVADLRSIDPSLELVCLDPGVWGVGSVRPTPARCAAGQRLGKEARTRRQRLFARLVEEGYSPIAVYEQRVPDQRIVKDVRLRDYNYRHHANRTVEAMLDDSDLHRQTAEQIYQNMRNSFEYGVRDRTLFRGAKHFGPGMRRS